MGKHRKATGQNADPTLAWTNADERRGIHRLELSGPERDDDAEKRAEDFDALYESHKENR